MKVFILSLLAFTFSAATIFAVEYPQGQVTVQVVDEEGKPVQDAKVSIGFEVAGKHDFGPETVPVEGTTDAQGRFTGTGRGSFYVTYSAEKEGYYDADGKPVIFKSHKNGKWEPWNPEVTVLLKKILDPVAMYARRISVKIPEENKPIGFDLAEGDLVAPYGKGVANDFVFTATKRVKSQDEYEMSVKLAFSNPGDGIYPTSFLNDGSIFRMARFAPETGYLDQWEVLRSWSEARGGVGEPNPDHCFFYRIRTVMKNGKVERALYGKIYGDIGMDPRKPSVLFTYYLNPNLNDRNMEFDPKKNLFKNLKSFDKPTAP